MSQDFKNRFSQYLSGNPTKPEQDKQAKPVMKNSNIEYYDEKENNVQNICFLQVSGKRIFLSYNYLVSGEYIPEENLIRLQFTTHKLELKGHNMEVLFNNLMQHSIKKIQCIDARYSSIVHDRMYVHEIMVSLYK